jgi:hypothetical protein
MRAKPQTVMSCDDLAAFFWLRGSAPALFLQPERRTAARMNGRPI